MRPLLALFLVAACGGTAPPPPAAPVAPPIFFTFHKPFWISLHERLYAESSPNFRARPDAPPAWTAAVELYRTKYPTRGLSGVFDPGLITLRAAWSNVDDSATPPDLSPELAAAAQVYRETLWNDDLRAAQALIDRLQPMIAAHGSAISAELTRIYQTPWPAAPIDVYISPYAGPVGAFTTDEPPRIALASRDTRHDGPAVLEILFHECSHVLVGKVLGAIEAAAKAQNVPAPQGLWHAVIFFTAGELTARRLGPDYVPYAVKNGLYARSPGWDGYEQALRATWVPYLDGKVTLDAAVAALVHAAATK